MSTPQQPPNPQPGPLPRWPLPGQAAQRASSTWGRFWKSFGGWKPQSKVAFGIGVGCAGILATCFVCSSLTIALGAALPPAPTQTISNRAAATATTPQQIAVNGDATSTTTAVATATASPSPSPSATAKPTPVPTKPSAPTQTPCANPCNPWGYNFVPGNYIYNPPSAFCSYFACINNFWNGSGYVMECKDGMYSKSGGRSGSCSYHGGNWRPLYSH